MTGRRKRPKKKRALLRQELNRWADSLKEDPEVQELLPLLDQIRPQTRGECEVPYGQKPDMCPWVGCKWHLYLDVNPTGHIVYNHPELMPWELVRCCALDVCDGGGETLEAVGDSIAVTRERIRQIESRTCSDIHERYDEDLNDRPIVGGEDNGQKQD